MTAVVALPGMPRESRGTIDPPTAALLADSGDTIPSGMPVPKRSGCFDQRTASEYPMKEAVVAPTPGRTPMSVPMMEERSNATLRFHISRSVGNSVRTLPPVSRIRPVCFSPDRFRTSARAKRPMMAGMKLIPVSRMLLPKLKRAVLVRGSIPTVARPRPIIPERRDLKTDFVPMEAIAVIPSTASAKYSGGPNSRANSARGGAIRIRTIVPKRPPMAEAPRA